jgi:hypothetical protein
MAKGKMTKGKMGKGEMAKIGGEMAKGELGKGEMGINQHVLRIYKLHHGVTFALCQRITTMMS